jgi:enamine deaminase RidA (YjgF/YER057c/UK114 family)
MIGYRHMEQIKRVNPESLKIPTNSYSQGIVIPLGVANLMFVTGQVAQDIEGEVIAVGDAEAQTRVIFSRIETILQEGGMTLGDLVKIQIFITNIKDKNSVQSVRNEILKNIRPVSTMVCVTSLAKDGCCVEIEATAVKLIK